MSGTVRVTGEKEGRNGINITAPDVITFEAGVEHSITAVTDNAKILHVYPIGAQVADAS